MHFFRDLKAKYLSFSRSFDITRLFSIVLWRNSCSFFLWSFDEIRVRFFPWSFDDPLMKFTFLTWNFDEFHVFSPRFLDKICVFSTILGQNSRFFPIVIKIHIFLRNQHIFQDLSTKFAYFPRSLNKIHVYSANLWQFFLFLQYLNENRVLFAIFSGDRAFFAIAANEIFQILSFIISASIDFFAC